MEENKISLVRRVATVILSIVTLVSLAPIVSVVVSGMLASHFGCQLDEGGTHPCHAFGTDIGDVLETMFVLGWLMLITIPVLIVAGVGWLVLFVTRRRR